MKKKSVIELNRINVEQFKSTEKIPLIVILDDIRSLNNIGSVFRTADAFVVEHIYLCGITATPPHPDIHKTALGAEDSVSWSYEKDAASLVERLRMQGIMVCAIEQVFDSISLPDFKTEQGKKYAIVMGNEVKGVSQAVVDAADCSIEIPQCGTKHSLNVSISAGIVIWDFFKQLHK
ncbi:MAG: RNA methyltransferase [Muribaculaceae bacterium]|nr:RNA methyltransferase [Muribaculaceae bacterium]